jgi:LPS sulfotransferase NodH
MRAPKEVGLNGSDSFPVIAASPSLRPDIEDLLGPAFDREASSPAKKTLIICAAPRTGSYELARLLTAAGVGVAHEYFHPSCANALIARWRLSHASLAREQLGNYVAQLRLRRCANDVFATKLQYWQYEDTLLNEHGRALFAHAVVVHLFRSDVAGQFASWRRACQSGRFGFTDRVTHPPRADANLGDGEALLSMIDELVMEDAKFRRFFVVAGIRPIFFEFDQLIGASRSCVETIADALGVQLDRARLDDALALSARYRREPGAEERERRLFDAARADPFAQ